MNNRDIREKVLAAMTNSDYKWRTARGIAKDSGVDIQDVFKVLEHSDQFIRARKSNKNGEALYSTKEKYEKEFGIGQRLLSIITNKVGG